VLLGREVTRPKELDVELPAAGEALPAGGLEVELDVAVAYEESPEAFAALLRKAPLAEVRLLRAAPQKGEPALLARAAVDLATLDADLVDATVPLCAATPAGRTAAAGPAPSTVTLSITAPPPDSAAATPRKPEPTTPPHSPPAAPPSRSPRKSPSKSPPNQIAMLEEARRLARANAKEAEEARRHARAAKEVKEAAAAAAARPPWDGSFDVESQNLSADERHWVGWREAQLEVLGKRPRAGELIVVLESRYHSGQGKQLVTQHDPAKYEGYAARLRAAVDELNARAGWRVADLVQVPREPTHWSKVLHGVDACRLGAFEIMASTLAAPPAAFAADGSATGGGGSGELTSHLLHSKLATRKWPSISRVEAALGRALRPLRIVPCVLCVDGSTRAVAPLPPQMSLVGEGKESLEVPLEYREGGDGDGDGEEGGGGGVAAAVTLAASSARFCVLKVAATADTEALESPMQVWPDDDGSLVARPALRPTARPFLLKLVCEAATPPHAPLPSA